MKAVELLLLIVITTMAVSCNSKKIRPTEKSFIENTRKTDYPPPSENAAEVQIDRIVVPTDFSENSLKALKYAVPFARHFGAKVALLHVVQLNYSGVEFGPVDVPQLEAEVTKGAMDQLQKLKTDWIPEGIEVEVKVLQGHPTHELCAFAQENKASLVIITTHGYTGFKHLLLGSTAETIVRHSPCPTLVVREIEHDFVGS